MLNNDWGLSKYPFVPGHEVAGTVTALGEESQRTQNRAAGRPRLVLSQLLVLPPMLVWRS
jgi:D-arabinose 1-dehydrogenase-like Zn-dependent alcohol dehydrogenase